jgi:hypothetical protein
MLSVKLDTGFNIEIDFPISPFHRRMFAFCVDTMVILLYWQLSGILFEFFAKRTFSELDWRNVLRGLPVLFY